MNRNEILSSLQENPHVSVLIVGGGINGIGTFRDLALNGVDVLLVERGDFCSGASAASSQNDRRSSDQSPNISCSFCR